jgi:hypothetical protein
MKKEEIVWVMQMTRIMTVATENQYMQGKAK